MSLFTINLVPSDFLPDGTKRARDLVNQILTFSRQAEHEMKPIDLNKITAEVVKLIRSTLPVLGN